MGEGNTDTTSLPQKMNDACILGPGVFAQERKETKKSRSVLNAEKEKEEKTNARQREPKMVDEERHV